MRKFLLEKFSEKLLIEVMQKKTKQEIVFTEDCPQLMPLELFRTDFLIRRDTESFSKKDEGLRLEKEAYLLFALLQLER